MRLSYDECLQKPLPRVCTVCAEPADDGPRFAVPTPFFTYAIGSLCIVCPPLFILGMRFVWLRRKMQVPMCPAHLARWRRWDRAATWGYLTVVCGTFAAAILLATFFPTGWAEKLFDRPVPGTVDRLFFALGYFVVALAWFVPMSLRQTRYVRITLATRRDIRLSGVHPGFVRAVREERARDPARLALFGDARDDYDDER
ncbi:MAG: hypothetical protein J2P46_02765 [Zavarzinella sp.]|nr:hypothetical protein [Zavarzinella sp.]